MNRREVLTGMAIASAAVAMPAVAMALPAQSDRRAWDAAMANLNAAHRASDAMGPTIDRIDAAFKRLCAKAPHKADIALVEAADARDAKIRRIGQRLGRDAAHDRYDALSDAICDAEAVLLKMPAPDGEALLWKVNRLYPEGENLWEAGHEAQTQADLRRFLSIGRA